MVFKSSKQRKAFFAQQRTPAQTQPNIIVFSYRTPDKKLGSFKSLKEAFKKFPSEKKAFQRVKQFRRKTGIRVNTIEEIKNIKKKQNIRRWN